ncbi:MAG: integrase arm-type DNA-binding domain-containing protein [Syntrophobacterales bacterium]|nr:integrase arm-type DNA-binding domain-containing protein [Syntrophobacterales bacterium]
MPRLTVPLTDLKVLKSKAKDKPYSLFDGGGLYIHILPTGVKLWRLKYRIGGKGRLMAIGKYPDVGLADARRKRDEARKLLADNIDPVVTRRAQKEKAAKVDTDSFEAIAREWYNKFLNTWIPGYYMRIISALERDVFPYIGEKPINEIMAPELLSVLQKIEERGAIDTAHRIRAFCGRIFRYAIATGRAHRDPSGDLRGAIPPPTSGHMAAITDPERVGELLRAIDDYTGSYPVLCALKLAPMLFVRPGELRKAEWAEISLNEAVWNIPADKMKMRVSHLVPLPRQAVNILKELYKYTGESKYCFPSARSFQRPMSDNAILSALRRMDFEKDEMSGHGFRAMARTILDEVLQVRPDIIEHQLAHQVKDPLGRAYNRTKFLPERRAMMQQWADYLEELKGGGDRTY